jgi:hypothetical protein
MMTTESQRAQGPGVGPDGQSVEAAAGSAIVPTALVGQDEWRQQLAAEMLERARTDGLRLVGRDGLLAGITKAGAGDGVADGAG